MGLLFLTIVAHSATAFFALVVFAACGPSAEEKAAAEKDKLPESWAEILGDDKKTEEALQKAQALASKNPCCCEYVLVDKTCYVYVGEIYCEDILKGKVHTVQWGKGNHIVNASCE